MSTVLIIAAIVTALPLLAIAVLAIGGLFVAKGHRLSRSVAYRVPPDQLWAIVTNWEERPSWRPSVEAIERLPDRDGHPVWREKRRMGGMLTSMVVTQAAIHRRLVTEIIDETAFSGRWAWEVAPSPDGGSVLTITETATIRNPVFRAVGAWFLDLHSTMDGVHRDLRRQLGEPPPVFAGPTADDRLRAETGRGIVFVCGASHSGTTLMLALLDSHPDIAGIPLEEVLFKNHPKEETIRQRVSEWPARFALDPSARLIAEKTPGYVLSLDRLLALFPEASIIVMLRDGRDAALSAAARVGDFRKAARRWRRAVEAAESVRGDDRIRVSRYEDLVADAESVLHRLCDFLGIPFDRAMLSHDRSPRLWWDTGIREADPRARLVGQNHLRNRNWQINQPIYDGSGRWRREMTEEQKAIFKAEAGAALIATGYASDDNW